MKPHKNAFDSMNAVIKILATTEDELQHKLMVACRDYLIRLGSRDFCSGLEANFNLLSNKLHMNDEAYQEIYADISDDEASKLATAICDFHLQVCEEYFAPGSYPA